MSKLEAHIEPNVDSDQPLDFMVASLINTVCADIHNGNVDAGWWNDLETGEDITHTRNTGEILMLVVSEISEAMEAHRKNLNDDKLTHRSGLEVELADALIRIFDLAGAYQLDLGGALVEKVAYNQKRADHRPENRRKDGGKKY